MGYHRFCYTETNYPRRFVAVGFLETPGTNYGVITVASESLGSAYRLTHEGVAQLVAISDSASISGARVPAYSAPSTERLTRLQSMIRHDSSKS